MSCTDKQRGVFPGLEFFTALGEIAKNATQQIKDIDRELNQSTTTYDLQDGTLWTELHLEFKERGLRSPFFMVYLRFYFIPIYSSCYLHKYTHLRTNSCNL